MTHPPNIEHDIGWFTHIPIRHDTWSSIVIVEKKTVITVEVNNIIYLSPRTNSSTSPHPPLQDKRGPLKCPLKATKLMNEVNILTKKKKNLTKGIEIIVGM